MAQDPLAPRKPAGRLSKAGSRGALIVLVVAFVVGLQLGAVPWRYRKQIWQIQGALVGVVIGFVLGRLSASDPEP